MRISPIKACNVNNFKQKDQSDSTSKNNLIGQNPLYCSFQNNLYNYPMSLTSFGNKAAGKNDNIKFKYPEITDDRVKTPINEYGTVYYKSKDGKRNVLSEKTDPQTRKVYMRTSFDEDGKTNFIVRFDPQTGKRISFVSYHKGTVKPKFEAKFDPKTNHITEARHTAENGNKISFTKYSPNTGDKLYEEHYDKAGNFDYSITYKYNKENQLDTVERKENDGTKTVLTYDTNNEGLLELTKYDADRNITSEDKFNSETKILYQSVKYKNGEKFEVREYNFRTGEIQLSTKYQNGQIIITHYNKKGYPEETIVYDKNHNEIYRMGE